MFEGLVAKLLNQYLGKYVQNLDSSNLNIGISSGEVVLNDLELRPEALYQLDLPIEVKAGYIGRIRLSIPWTSLYSSPVLAELEDVYILAGPVSDREYDAKKEEALARASKLKKLEDLENATGNSDDDNSSNDQGIMDRLVATIINNIQLSIKRIHIRYEDKVTNPTQPFACGLMMRLLSAETTDTQWKPAQVDANVPTVNKLARLNGLSIYWNAFVPDNFLIRNKLRTNAWRNLLKNSIENHRILEGDLDFILKPVSANAKLKLNKKVTDLLPKVLVDFVMDEIEILFNRQQFLCALCLNDSFKLMAVNQKYRKYKPKVPTKGNAKAWWLYAYTSVVEETIRPWSWENISKHRERFRLYKTIYKHLLQQPEAENIKLNAQLEELELKLDVTNIVIAREEAKLEFSKEAPSRIKKKKVPTATLR